jgi:hypothetical protein
MRLAFPSTLLFEKDTVLNGNGSHENGFHMAATSIKGKQIVAGDSKFVFSADLLELDSVKNGQKSQMCWI